MEFKLNSRKDKRASLIDVTIAGNPPPQASSTHEKKTTLGNWEIGRASNEENKTRRSLLNDSDAGQITVDSSLGILNNISSCKFMVLGDSGVMEEKCSSSISSKIDTERELARKLLQRCNEPTWSLLSLDRDKENDGNLQNLSVDNTPSTLTDSGQQSLIIRNDIAQNVEPRVTDTVEHSVIFKPNEISARSSVLNSSFNKSSGGFSASPPRKGGISFDTTAAAELMAQFGDEEFQSCSRVGSRILGDELSWNQNYSYVMPINSSAGGEKERLELSCFSGVVGDFDLSLESYAGRKVSVGEFFQRKCGNIGQLQESDSMPRPSFGLTMESPKQRGTTGLLVDKTIMIEEPSIREGQATATGSADCTYEHSLMSLTSIANVLHDLETGSPRRLIDELILAKRNKKLPPSQLSNVNKNTFTYPAENSFNSTSLSTLEKPKRDTVTNKAMSLLDSARFSLDSKIASDTRRGKSKPIRMSLSVATSTPTSNNASCSYTRSFAEERVDPKKEIPTTDVVVKSFDEPKERKKSACYSNITKNRLCSLDDSTVPHDSKENLQSAERGMDISRKNSYKKHESKHIYKNEQNVLSHSKTKLNEDPLPIQNPTVYLENIKCENDTLVSRGPSPNYKVSLEETFRSLSENTKTNNKSIATNKRDTKIKSSVNVDQLHHHKKIRSHGNVLSARNTTELFSCIVGVSREAEIELLNESDRWMTCTLTLHQIQGTKENIAINLPEDTILVEPDRAKLVKIGVTVRQMGSPIIVSINIAVSDMVTRSNQLIKHVMCFVPEEPQIGVVIHSGNDEINFKTVAEKCSEIFPITVENKNNAEIPMRIMILQRPDEPQLFTINGPADPATTNNDTFNKIKYNLTLKPHQQFAINIQFNGSHLTMPNTRKGLCNVTGKLIIQLRTDDLQGLVLREIILNGSIATSKIELFDTPLPVIIPKKESKPISLINTGDLAVLLTATIVEDDKSTSSAGDFTLKPTSLFLQPGEKGVIMVSFKSARGNVSSERHVFVRVAAGGNEYYYPAAGVSHASDQLFGNNAQRCTTPQSQPMNSPNSPHSSASNKSGHSGRHSPGSAASTSTVSGDVIPIQSTHAALVWSSVRTGKSNIKEFTVLNNSENKIKLQVNIVDRTKSFKFLKERNAVASMLLVLPRMGSKEISVVFSPSNLGACAGKIVFTHYNNAKDQEESCQRKTIFLYGYGGFSKIEISQAFKDTGGLMWLSLGHMNAGRTLSAKIKLQNTGDLCSYGVVKLTPKALYPAMVSSWYVNPTELLLGPGEVQWVKLEFRPRQGDLALLRRADVSHVGTLTITHGDEPTRWRIRRLYNKLKDSGKLKGAENDTFRNIVFPLCKAFPGEVLVQDLSLIKDSVQHIGDLCRGVSQHQVMLTMEVNADETMTMLNDNADDTQMFYSVCSDSSSIFASGCDSYMPSETITDANERELSENDFTVTPAAVSLAPPFRTEATITVSSLCCVAQPFETVLSYREGLSVIPTEGMIPAGGSFPLKVQCTRNVNKTLTAVLQIFMENHKREVLVTVSSSH